jgi:hypothetical protein
MRSLSQYAFVYISTHAGPLPNNDAAVATGDTRHQPFATYLENYSLAEMKIASQGVTKYFDAVTGRFIHRYDGQFPEHTIVFLNACNALDMPLFWRYLKQSGVATLISWHHHVTVADSDRAAETLFAQFALRKTISEAVSTTTASGYGISVTGKKQGWLSFIGDGSGTLQAASGFEEPILASPHGAPAP